MKICKRCGRKLPKFTIWRLCHPCRNGAGRLYQPPEPRRSPEIPTATERNQRRH